MEEKVLVVSIDSNHKTTKIFDEFDQRKGTNFEPFEIIYYYDKLCLKDFFSISMKINGKSKHFSVSLLVKRIPFWIENTREIRDRFEIGYTMSDLVRDYHRKNYFNAGHDIILSDIFSSVERSILDRNMNSIIKIKGFELYAQDSFLRNNPGAGIEYGDVRVYYVDEITIKELGLVWD